MNRASSPAERICWWISLRKITELQGIEEKKGFIHIGSMVTPNEIATNPLVLRFLPALAEAAGSMASNQIRSLATIGGNIASAVPSADLPPVLIAAGSTLRLQCLEDRREVPFTGPRMSICREEEILTAVVFPLPGKNTGFSYRKVMLREANALAVASVASRIELEAGRIKDAAIVLGAVAPIPLLALKASEYLRSKEPSEKHFMKSAALAKKECHPITDIRGSIWYRKELVEVLTRRSLEEASARAQGIPLEV
jgi:carbon-monoxide dehydrogenase medium subunit